MSQGLNSRKWEICRVCVEKQNKKSRKYLIYKPMIEMVVPPLGLEPIQYYTYYYTLFSKYFTKVVAKMNKPDE